MTKKTAWVLHDDPPSLGLIRGILNSAGYEVTTNDSAMRAISGRWENPSAAPALVLLGLTAIDDRDLEIVTLLRQRWVGARILVLFPAILRERAARALDLGADGYLPEPFYPSELTALARVTATGDAAPGPTSPQATTAVESESATVAPLGDRGGTADSAPDAETNGATNAPTDGATNGTIARLSGGIAHSIRNPLQILELQLGTFETDGKLDREGMREQLRRIAEIVESLARFSGRRKLNMRLIDVNALVQRAFQAARPPSRVAVRLALSQERLEILGAPDLLRAALDALRIRAERVTTLQREVEVSTALVKDGDRRIAEITVTDGGARLTPPLLASFFDPFPDADQIQDGTGLEMAAAAGVIRNHGGTAGARAGSSHGTTVVVRLPTRGTPGRTEEA